MAKDPIIKAVYEVDKTVEDTVDSIDKAVDPYRRSAFRRFPVLFTLLVAFGATTTFFGFERVISEIVWLNERPLMILLVGIATLIITGTLYKKLK